MPKHKPHIQGLHGQNYGGRDLVVNEARPMGPALPVAVASAVATAAASAAGRGDRRVAATAVAAAGTKRKHLALNQRFG